MLLILAGEGSTDMGGMSPDGPKPGPMAHIVDKIVENRFDFSPLSVGRVEWISRSELSRLCKEEGLRPPRVLPGARRASGYAGYTKHAAALSSYAKERESDENDKVVAVIFRDSDGTRSAPMAHWQNVVDAIQLGFDAMEFERGVAMVPKPKQEAWLLCAKKEEPYMHCELLEQASGNDDCPNPLKDQLVDACGCEPTTEEQCEWIASGEVDLSRIEMPSFSRFRSRLIDVLNRM